MVCDCGARGGVCGRQFSNLVYSVSLKLPKSWWNVRKLRENWRSRSVRKTILHGVSGTARPGEMLVMLGPSGSGKTTLLKLLGGRLKGKLKEGSILYNGEPYSTAVKRRTGFVTQDDVLFPHLTVKDTLVYAAMLRLPNTFTRQEKVQYMLFLQPLLLQRVGEKRDDANCERHGFTFDQKSQTQI